MNKKNLIIIIFLLLVITICAVISIKLLHKNKNDNTKVEDKLINIENQDVLKNINFDNITVSNQVLNVKDGSSSYLALLTNNSNEDYKIDTLYVTFVIDDQEIKSLALVDTVINANDSRYVNVIIDSDLTKITDIKYEHEEVK